MDAGKLNNLITRKNERLEQDALDNASSIIDAIAAEQQKIADSNKRIGELQAELKALEVNQIDPAKVLGQ